MYLWPPSEDVCVCPAFVYRPVSLTVFAGAENNVWLVNCSKKGRVKVWDSIRVNINQVSFFLLTSYLANVSFYPSFHTTGRHFSWSHGLVTRFERRDEIKMMLRDERQVGGPGCHR